MPWDAPLKKVVRKNTDFTGSNVWLQDKQANIKIIAQRHDTHDEDLAQAISACLNIDGINAMRADLNMDNHKVVNMLPGTAGLDGVNWNQLDAVKTLANTAQASADSAHTRIDGLPASTQITSQSWDSVNFTSVRQGGPSLVTPISHFASLRVGGLLLHKLAGGVTGTLSVTTAQHRWRVINNGALTLNFVVPTAADTLLSTNFVMEGNILFTNGSNPGPIDFTFSAGPSALGADEVLGGPSMKAAGLAGSKYMLSYYIQFLAVGSYNRLMVWSSAP